MSLRDKRKEMRLEKYTNHYCRTINLISHSCKFNVHIILTLLKSKAGGRADWIQRSVLQTINFRIIIEKHLQDIIAII
ncbi:hypothetical protein DPMN_031032 [Dreissena polymorpha]|uniref:Uncharacterized protein n=1 Tax=Dreissena polymorpha TaxID=45954 RepID=A0A9D4M142_DREPO|nr:hypothetical protein DPMN_031032 [Dreissena polymorpha]